MQANAEEKLNTPYPCGRVALVGPDEIDRHFLITVNEPISFTTIISTIHTGRARSMLLHYAIIRGWFLVFLCIMPTPSTLSLLIRKWHTAPRRKNHDHTNHFGTCWNVARTLYFLCPVTDHLLHPESKHWWGVRNWCSIPVRFGARSNCKRQKTAPPTKTIGRVWNIFRFISAGGKCVCPSMRMEASECLGSFLLFLFLVLFRY